MKKETVKKIVMGAFVLVTVGSLVGSVAYFFPRRGSSSQTNVPAEVKKAMEVVNEMVKAQGQSATLSSWEEVEGVYKIVLKIGDQEYESFVTKGGKYLFPYGIDLAQAEEQAKNQQGTNQGQTAQQVEKRERPDVKVFVMSYCPFGLQMEKAILPVWELLKEKADFGIYFVNYIMHDQPELEENLRQYCIEKEEKEKFLAYLKCFVEEGNYAKCIEKANIDREKLKECWKKTDEEFKITQNTGKEGYPPFPVHDELNKKYNVSGSPTLVINDVVVNADRVPEKLKQIICDAFVNPPSECEQKLSEQPASPGFGTGTISESSGGSCQ